MPDPKSVSQVYKVAYLSRREVSEGVVPSVMLLPEEKLKQISKQEADSELLGVLSAPVSFSPPPR